MAYEFDVTSWEDWDGNVHKGTPTDVDPEEVHGTFSRYTDPQTGDTHYHWVYTDDYLDSWDDWYDLIAIVIEDHGYET